MGGREDAPFDSREARGAEEVLAHHRKVLLQDSQAKRLGSSDSDVQTLGKKNVYSNVHDDGMEYRQMPTNADSESVFRSSEPQRQGRSMGARHAIVDDAERRAPSDDGRFSHVRSMR